MTETMSVSMDIQSIMLGSVLCSYLVVILAHIKGMRSEGLSLGQLSPYVMLKNTYCCLSLSKGLRLVGVNLL